MSKVTSDSGERTELNELAGTETSNSIDVNDNAFDFESFAHYISKCSSENETDKDVDLDSYLLAYGQLYNFFCQLGGAFQFVASDVKTKIKILEEYRENEKKKDKTINNFSTVKKMIKYEKTNDMFSNSKYVSGSRTLLRLHRGMDFVRKFLKEIYGLQEDIKLGNTARQVYDATLAQYHTWVVRSTARVAMQFLPTRMEFFKKITQNNEEKLNLMQEKLPDSLQKMNITYDKVQNIYTENDILDLP